MKSAKYGEHCSKRRIEWRKSMVSITRWTSQGTAYHRPPQKTGKKVPTLSMIVEASELQKFKLGANAFLLGVDGL